jgi:hypothetical protein
MSNLYGDIGIDDFDPAPSTRIVSYPEQKVACDPNNCRVIATFQDEPWYANHKYYMLWEYWVYAPPGQQFLSPSYGSCRVSQDRTNEWCHSTEEYDAPSQ